MNGVPETVQDAVDEVAPVKLASDHSAVRAERRNSMANNRSISTPAMPPAVAVMVQPPQ